MEKRGVSDGDFVLVRMAAVGHDVDVSMVDQEALAWFLDCGFAKGLKGKSDGGQGGAAFQAAKGEMAKYKISDADFVRMRMAAVGRFVDLSEVDQTALAWFRSSEFAKGLKDRSLADQSGSKREVNKRTSEWLWREYKRHVGENPVAANSNDPLLVSLPELRAHASDGVFDNLVLAMLTSSDWDADRFSKNNGVDKISETIRDQTFLQYGAHIATTAPNYKAQRLACIRQIQKKWDTQTGTRHIPWEPPKPDNYLQLTKTQKSNARKREINDKYQSMKREVQISVVTTFPVEDRARLAVTLALNWYHNDRV
jgi:hypothetical protein